MRKIDLTPEERGYICSAIKRSLCETERALRLPCLTEEEKVMLQEALAHERSILAKLDTSREFPEVHS